MVMYTVVKSFQLAFAALLVILHMQLSVSLCQNLSTVLGQSHSHIFFTVN